MATSVTIRNMHPSGAVELWVDGQHHTVPAAGELSVPPEDAGQPPYWRALSAEEVQELAGHGYDTAALPEDFPTERAIQLTGRAYRVHGHPGGSLEVLDLGSGLLAQTDNWAPIDASTDEE